MIEVRGLTKRFGDVDALRGVSFSAADGQITGLLGPNGAGKSTCLRILSTVLKPNDGSAVIGGHEVARQPLAVRRDIGVLPHGSGLYPNLTALENIRYYGELHGMRAAAIAARCEELVARLDMASIANRRAKGFSQGERTKVALARALVHRPRHVILDEPSNGLDVMATRQLRDWLRELAQAGHCVLLSSHVMQEVAALVDTLAIVAAGRIVADGTPAQLRERFGREDLEEVFVAAVSQA
ncbi:MAG: ATP-binding cassette domain-containing protein [Gammaproteobacteria bacterium]|jgi:sodium transport system ATP-binding protein